MSTEPPPSECPTGTCPHVMQTRCTWCRREQYGMYVWPISHGLRGCTWCSRVPAVYTDASEYRNELGL